MFLLCVVGVYVRFLCARCLLLYMLVVDHYLSYAYRCVVVRVGAGSIRPSGMCSCAVAGNLCLFDVCLCAVVGKGFFRGGYFLLAVGSSCQFVGCLRAVVGRGFFYDMCFGKAAGVLCWFDMYLRAVVGRGFFFGGCFGMVAGILC